MNWKKKEKQDNMEIEYQDIITLSDNNEYLVASKVNYNDSQYIYLVDINDNKNLKFAEIENNCLISELDSILDEELINNLIPLFYNICKNDIEYIS